MKKTIKAANWVHDTVDISYNKSTRILTLWDYKFNLVFQTTKIAPDMACHEVAVYHDGDQTKGKGWEVVVASRFDSDRSWLAATPDGWSVVREDEDMLTAVGQVLANLG